MRRHKCSMCLKSFESGHALKAHNKLHSVQEEQHVTCPQADSNRDGKNFAHDRNTVDRASSFIQEMVLDRLHTIRKRKRSVELHVAQAKSLIADTIAELRPRIEAAAANSDVATIFDDVSEALVGLRSAHLEKKHRTESLPNLVKPVRRLLGKRKDGSFAYAWDTKFEDVLKQWLMYNHDARRDVLNSVARWNEHNPDRLCDFTDGAAMRTDGILHSPGAIPFLIGFYGDGVGISNPIGVFKNSHGVWLFYWFSFNLLPDHRLSLHNIHLATAVYQRDIDEFGIDMVLSGGDSDGGFTASTSFGAAMHRLARGIQVRIPNPSLSPAAVAKEPTVFVHLKGGTKLVTADAPAHSKMGNLFNSSFGSNVVSACRCCTATQIGSDGYSNPSRRPNSFLPWQRDGTCPSCDMRRSLDNWKTGVHCHFTLRTPVYMSDLEKEYERVLQVQGSPAAAKLLKAHGVKSFQKGMIFPGLSGFETPQDIMHVMFEGVTSLEYVIMLRVFIKEEWFSLEDYNNLVANYWGFQDLARKLQSVRAYDLEKEKLPYTAHEMMVMALHSVEMLSPYVEDWNHPCWQAWIVHAQICALILRERFSLDDVRRLDLLIYKHDDMILRIECYRDIWRPKHHWRQHVPMDALLWGPPRFYMCMMLECMNQQYKQEGKASNFKSLLFTMTMEVAIKRAWDLASGVHLNRLEPRFKVALSSYVTQQDAGDLKALWEAGLVKYESVQVSKLAIVQRGHGIFRPGSWILLSAWNAPIDGANLCHIHDLLAVNRDIYLRVRFPKQGILRRDVSTNALCASNRDLLADQLCEPLVLVPFASVRLRALVPVPARGSDQWTVFIEYCTGMRGVSAPTLTDGIGGGGGKKGGRKGGKKGGKKARRDA